MNSMVLNTRILDNRLTLIHYAIETPGYAVGVRLEAGSRHDPPAQRGLAHVLEHVLLHLPNGEGRELLYGSSDGKIRTEGGWTTREETVYRLNTSVEALPRALEWLSRALFEPKFVDEVLHNQLRVIDSESERHRPYRPSVPVRKRLDFDSAFFDEACLADATIGHESTRATITIPHLSAWHAANYVGARASVVVVGPGESKAVFDAVAATFEHVPEGTPPPRLEPAHFGHGTGRRIRRSSTDTGSKTYIHLGYRTAGTSDPDWPMFGLLYGLISKRLDKSLRNDLGLTYNIHASRDGGPDWGRFHIYVDALPKEGKKLLREVDGLLDDMLRLGFSQDELTTALARSQTRIDALSSPDEILTEIIWQLDGWVLHPNGPVEWNAEECPLDRVNEAASRLLDPRRTVTMYAEGHASGSGTTTTLIVISVLTLVLSLRNELSWLGAQGWSHVAIWWARIFG